MGLLAVDLTTTGTVIGLCGLLKRDEYPDFDLGFAFLERYRGQGYAREAATTMLRIMPSRLLRSGDPRSRTLGRTAARRSRLRTISRRFAADLPRVSSA